MIVVMEVSIVCAKFSRNCSGRSEKESNSYCGIHNVAVIIVIFWLFDLQIYIIMMKTKNLHE